MLGKRVDKRIFTLWRLPGVFGKKEICRRCTHWSMSGVLGKESGSDEGVPFGGCKGIKINTKEKASSNRPVGPDKANYG